MVLGNVADILDVTVGVLEVGEDVLYRAEAAIGAAMAQAVEASAAAAVGTEFMIGVGVFEGLAAVGGVPRLEAGSAFRGLIFGELFTIDGDMPDMVGVGASDVANVGF